MDYTSQESIAQTRQVFDLSLSEESVLGQIAAQSGADAACLGEICDGPESNGEASVSLSDALDASQLAKSTAWREINSGIQNLFDTFDAKSRNEKLSNEIRLTNLNKAQAVSEVMALLAQKFAQAEERLSKSSREEQRAIGADGKQVVKSLTSSQARILSDRDREALRENAAKVRFIDSLGKGGK